MKYKLILILACGFSFEQNYYKTLASAVKFAKKSGFYAYKVLVDGKMVANGYCND